MLVLHVVVALVCAFGLYLAGVARGAAWGRRVAARAYEAGRDDAIAYVVHS